MKIYAINNNTFKGLFTDKSKENKNNDWLMEYRPYSWELDSRGWSIMDRKQHIDVTADKLPNNEELYIPIQGDEPERSKDILGTESYYRYPDHIMNGRMRSTITVSAPLNREESLKVYLEKMNMFRAQKVEAQKRLGKFSFDDVKSKFHDFFDALQAYNEALIFKKDEKERMVDSVRNMYFSSENLFNQANKYLQMTESLVETDKTITDIKEELATIADAKKEGKAIDISVRKGQNPNEALDAYIENKSCEDVLNENYLLILPTMVITFKKFVEKFCPTNVTLSNQSTFVDQVQQSIIKCIRGSVKR